MVRRVALHAGWLAWLILAAAFAQNVTLRATVDRPTVRENESFTYTIHAEGAVRGEPDIEPLQQQFDVMQSSSSSQIRIINGQTSQSIDWQFQLMPKRTGDFVVPPVHIGDAATNPVQVRVTAQPAGGAPADIFMELEADPSPAYVQAQIVFTLRLFKAVNTGRATLTPPEISGGEAIVEKLGEDSQYRSQRAGRDFEVFERRYAVFPQTAGTLTIGPVTFEAMVIPDRGFSRVQRFRSSTLDIDVQPAVAPPASSPNAAWLPARAVRLSETWSDDSPELAVGTPRTRKIVVEADGLLETQLPDLPIEQQGAVRQYADQPDLEHEATPQGLRSRRTVSYAVIAQAPGDVTVAAVRLPWWNVTERRWEVAELPERVLHVVAAGDAQPETPAPAPEDSAVVAAEPAARNYWPLAAAAIAVVWVGTLLLWWRSRAPRSPRAPSRVQERTPGERRTSPKKLLHDVQSACAAADADGTRRALLAWGEAHYPQAPPRSLGALAAHLQSEAAREVLDLEAHIYGAQGGPWDGRALAAALAALESAAADAARKDDEPLLPLYR
jgi:hypothetical protein